MISNHISSPKLALICCIFCEMLQPLLRPTVRCCPWHRSPDICGYFPFFFDKDPVASLITTYFMLGRTKSRMMLIVRRRKLCARIQKEAVKTPTRMQRCAMTSRPFSTWAKVDLRSTTDTYALVWLCEEDDFWCNVCQTLHTLFHF